MPLNATQKLIDKHIVDGQAIPGNPIALKFDQTLCQDATGTLVMLTLEAMNLETAKTKVSVQYVDHNLLQDDNKNPDDHIYLQSAAEKFGFWFSRPGNGISHPLHMMYFGEPGDTLIGSDSHTCAAGSLGMLAVGAGGTDVALAVAGEPVHLAMPKIWGVELTGQLQPWVSAKDIILEMLRRHGVRGAVNCVIEYYGEGLENLSAMDRHVIANMGAELGATATVFPSDHITRAFLKDFNRENDWQELKADDNCRYDFDETVDLSEIEPMIAKPSSPENVVPVSSVEGEPIYQTYVGSSANPGYRDFAIVAEMVKEHSVAPGVSFDINPSARVLLMQLANEGYLSHLLSSGARLHQAGCNGCIGMGQAPATGRNSLRTTPRNFPGRSGTKEDSVWLCSPETAAASAIMGKIADPRRYAADNNLSCPEIPPAQAVMVDAQFLAPKARSEINREFKTIKGPNIVDIPQLEPIPDSLSVPIILSLGDDVSTDEILPAGTEVLPYRSNINKISEFCFKYEAQGYYKEARACREAGQGHAIVAGSNYGQGSSREHAALAPRTLGLQVVLAKSFARIHRQNLINFGVLPLQLLNEEDYNYLMHATRVLIHNAPQQIMEEGEGVVTVVLDEKIEIQTKHNLSDHQKRILIAGGVIPMLRPIKTRACLH